MPLTRGGALDALRFLAAFFMVLHHYSAESPIRLDKLHPVFERGYLATDFFLMVSGYVMGRIYGDRVVDGRMSVGAFFLRRAGRVVPAHLMMAAAYVALVLATAALGVAPTHPEWFQWRELPAQVLLIQAFGPFGGKGWNAPTWSLSALLGCYLMFPLLWRGLRRIKSPSLALALGLGGMAAADFLTQKLLGYPVYQMPMWYGFIRALPLFLTGVALAVCSESLYIPPRSAMAFGLAALVLLILLQNVGRFDFLTLSLVALVILAAGAVPPEKPSKVLEKAALISFALFITNEFVRVVYFGAFHAVEGRLALSTSTQWAVWFGGPAVAVACATAFHYLVDWPSQARIKAWLAGGAPALKDQIAALAPRPDPQFDPQARSRQARPRGWEVHLDVGPRPGGQNSDGQTWS